MSMKFVVSGICMVPVKAEITVDADSPEHALELAQAAFNRSARDLIIAGSSDESAAHDWQPDAMQV
jgi:hypothetical protein